jgi:hypothetical protein
MRRVKFNLHIGNKEIYLSYNIILARAHESKVRLQTNVSEMLLQDISNFLVYPSALGMA